MKRKRPSIQGKFIVRRVIVFFTLFLPLDEISDSLLLLLGDRLTLAELHPRIHIIFKVSGEESNAAVFHKLVKVLARCLIVAVVNAQINIHTISQAYCPVVIRPLAAVIVIGKPKHFTAGKNKPRLFKVGCCAEVFLRSCNNLHIGGAAVGIFFLDFWLVAMFVLDF